MSHPLITPPEPAVHTAFNAADLESIDGDQLLQDVTQFVGRYLQCSEHQRTVMALWVLHTHCLSAVQVTPYLAIQSTEKQSGKTLCLQLLNLLCESPALTAGFTANTLTRRIDSVISTVLLDECQATVGTRNRSKSPALRAILASGYHCGPGYTDATHERHAFAPKAFAGMGQLPEALADRSIPIILEPLDKTTKIQRFNLRRAAAEAKPLQEQILDWSLEHDEELEEKPSYAAEDFPPGLSPRRQDMIEPLLQLADFIGAEWPARIREALAAIFEEEAAFELKHSLQLLADIRDCFAHHGYPKRLSTAALLAWTHTLPARPWDVDGPITARSFARLLMPFEIHPRVQRIGSDDPARGYRLDTFAEHWKTHLGFEVPPRPTPEEIVQRFQAAAGLPLVSPKAKSQEPKAAVSPNKDAVCNAVTDCGELSISAAGNPVATAKLNGQTGNPVEELPNGGRIQPQKEWENGFHGTVQQSAVPETALVGAAS
jgi:Protein of unknown function (DUF3631)